MEIGNHISILLSFAGGLALFLFGMNVMGDALRSLTGSGTREKIAGLCRTPLRGALLGALVTALVQSSSATTVTVIGFVNSGMMTLSQSIGVIMGANLGTTVTSWLLALTNIGSGGFLRLLDPEFFAPLLGIAGLILLKHRGGGTRRQLGFAFLGFTVLIFGLEAMSGAVSPLSEQPGFVSLLTAFSRPIPGFLAGALTTALIQSSSASVGILGALASTGAISIGASVPIILGQNVGTCITTLISGVGASKNARRAAFVHLYFNLIGAAVQLTVFLLADLILAPALFAEAASITTIAVVHTLFNIVSLLLMLPFTGFLEKLAVRTVPEHGQKKAPQNGAEAPARIPPGFEGCRLLDDRFLAMPSFALTMCRAAAGRMAELNLESLSLLSGILSGSAEDDGRIAGNAALTAGYRSGLLDYLTRLASGRIRLRARETALVTHLLTVSGELARIGELAGEAAAALRECPADYRHSRTEERICADVLALLNHAVRTEAGEDPDSAPRSGGESPFFRDGKAEEVAVLSASTRRNRLEILSSGGGSAAAFAALDAVTVCLEHIAAHAERLVRSAE